MSGKIEIRQSGLIVIRNIVYRKTDHTVYDIVVVLKDVINIYYDNNENLNNIINKKLFYEIIYLNKK